MSSNNKRNSNKPLPLIEDVEHQVDSLLVQKIEKPFYRIEKISTYDWILIEKIGNNENIIKKDTQDICWAFMKRALIQGFR